jgi:F-type H+-transporting ATPase subunit epsilon
MMDTNKLLDVNIVSPKKVIFSGKAVSVSVPGSQSPFQILYNHAPIVSALDLGVVKIVDDNEKPIYFATTKGFAEVRKNVVSILVDNAENAADYNINEANEKLSAANSKFENAKSPEEKEIAKMELDETRNLLKAVAQGK